MSGRRIAKRGMCPNGSDVNKMYYDSDIRLRA